MSGCDACLCDLLFFSTEAASARAGGTGGGDTALQVGVDVVVVDTADSSRLSVASEGSGTGVSPVTAGVASPVVLVVDSTIAVGVTSPLEVGENSSVEVGVSVSETEPCDATTRYNFWMHVLTALVRA